MLVRVPAKKLDFPHGQSHFSMREASTSEVLFHKPREVTFSQVGYMTEQLNVSASPSGSVQFPVALPEP
jgi:hypothetical protein